MKDSGQRNNLEAVRIECGLTRPQLAEKVGTTETTIYRKERGKRGLSDKEAPRYAKALGVEVSRLFSEKEKPLHDTEVLMMSVFIDILSLLVGRQIPKDQIIEKINYRKASFEKYQMHHSLRLLKILEDCVHDKSRAAELQLVQLFSAPYQAKED